MDLMSVSTRITHYIPPAKPLPKLVGEFVEPVPDDYFIFWLFRYRCQECNSGQHLEINEINPRGRSKKNILNWENRVVLCRTCHEKFHHNGVTREKIQIMQKRRKTYLISIGRERYINGTNSNL